MGWYPAQKEAECSPHRRLKSLSRPIQGPGSSTSSQEAWKERSEPCPFMAGSISSPPFRLVRTCNQVRSFVLPSPLLVGRVWVDASHQHTSAASRGPTASQADFARKEVMVAVPAWVRKRMPHQPEVRLLSVALAIQPEGSLPEAGQTLALKVEPTTWNWML